MKGNVKSDDEEGLGGRGAEVKGRRQRCFGCDSNGTSEACLGVLQVKTRLHTEMKHL